MIIRKYANGRKSENPVPSLIEGVETRCDECNTGRNALNVEWNLSPFEACRD